MPETQAEIGYRTFVEIADPATPATRIPIGEVMDITLPSEETDQVEVTNMDSPAGYKEFIAALTDGGELSFDMNFVPDSASDLALRQARGLTRLIFITFPTGPAIHLRGSRQSYERTSPVQEQMTGSVAFKISGAPDYVPAASPVQITAPTVPASATVGVPLLSDEGRFRGATDIAIQWQQDNAGGGTFVDIAGANGTAYTPNVANVGNRLRVRLTVSNPSFSITVDSDPTAAVAAAA